MLSIQDEIALLRLNNDRLRAENGSLRRKVAFYESHPWVVEGIKGENVIAKLVCGNITGYTCSHDIETVYAQTKIEVKLANLNVAVIGCGTKRWAWIRPFGETGTKKYDNLILLGETDVRFRHKYKDPDSPFVIFDIPYHEVRPLTSKSMGRVQIILTTNPDTVSSARGKALYQKYQVSRKELEERYKGPTGPDA